MARKKPGTIQLDPNGDAILSVKVPGDDATTKTKEFLVSTTVLSLASPVFSKMFQSAFSESVAVKEGKRPTIELKEDDADAMDTILRVLHYKSNNLPDDVEPMTIALVAIHADKYQLQGPLKPWAFRLNDSFANTSREAIKDMKPGFTGVPETVELPIKLPLYVIITINSEIKSLRDRLDAQIQFVERKLRARKASYRIPDYVCAACSGIYLASDTECCGGAKLRPKMCNHEYQAFEYFSLMARCELWPPAQYFENLSASKIIDRLPRVEKKLKTHHCDGHDNCPLRKEMEGLVESMRDFYDKIDGLAIEEEEKDDDTN